MIREYIVRIDDTLTGWQDDAEVLEYKWGAEPIEDVEVKRDYLNDWYISSVSDDPPVWTEGHIAELVGDFYLIPKEKNNESNGI